MTDIGIAIEYEASLAFSGEQLKECSVCHEETHRNYCLTCKTPDGDPLPIMTKEQSKMAKVIEFAENSDTLVDLETLLSEGFEPVER